MSAKPLIRGVGELPAVSGGTPESQVRIGLAAGGRWIRTSGSARQVDVGTVVNPIGLKGQIHGGVVQGLGQALVSRRLAG
jgi:hypothetical protein